MANETDKLGIILETTSEGTGFEDVQDDFEQTKKSGEESAKAIETSYQESLTSIRNASAIAFAAVGAAIGLSVREAAQAEQGMVEFASAVRNTGGNADELSERLNNTSANLQRLTGIVDDQFIGAAARMTDITGDAGDSIDKLSLVADFAVARKIDLASAADMVAKATLGEVGMLSRLLPGLDEQVLALGENVDKGQIAGVIFERLAQFQGRAADSADTASGSMNILKGEISQTAENIGNAFLPAVRSATEALTGVAKAAGDFAKEHETATTVLSGTTVAVIGLVASFATIVSAAPVVKKALDLIKTSAIGLASPFAVIASGIIVVGSVMYQLRDAMAATGDSEAELNDIVKETGVEYQTLRLKQEEIFGKFDSYRTATDEQREAWDSYITALKTGMPTLDEVVVQMQKAVGGLSATPLKPLNLQINETIGSDPSGGFDFAAQNEAQLQGQIYLNDRITADNQETSAETQAIWKQNRDAFLYHTGYLQDTYRTAIGTFADTEMTGKERREAIWGQFRSSVVGYVADITARYIFGQLAMRAASVLTSTTGIAASAAASAIEIGLAKKTAASWMGVAYAKLVGFYALSGPFAPALAGATIAGALGGLAGVGAATQGVMAFQEGGIVPGAGRGDRVPAMLEPGEGILTNDAMQKYPGAMEAMNSGKGLGGGNTFVFQLNRDAGTEDVLRIRQLFETWVVPVIEQKQREGAFTRVGIPA